MRVMTSKLSGILSVVLVIAVLLSVVGPSFAAANKAANGQIVISSFTDTTGSININAGKAEGVVVGAKGVIVRDGKQIADYEVIRVGWGLSSILVTNLASGYRVEAGDSAPLTVMPAEKKTKSGSNKIWKTIGIVAAVALVAILASNHHSSGSSDNSGDLVKVSSSSETVKCDGTSGVTITATVSDGISAVADGTQVTFTATDASGNSIGTFTKNQVSTSSGKASTYLKTSTNGATSNSGTVTVKASVASGSSTISGNTTVQFVSCVVGNISLSSSSNSIRGWDISGKTATITANVTNTDGVRIPDDTLITFSISPSGAVSLSSNTAKTSSGSGSITLTSIGYGNTNSSWDGKLTVTATSENSVIGTKVITLFGAPNDTNTTATIGKSELKSYGDSATVTVKVFDTNNNPVTDGVTIQPSASPGTVSSSSVSPNSDGTATFTLSTSTDKDAPTPVGDGTLTINIVDSNGSSTITKTIAYTIVSP